MRILIALFFGLVFATSACADDRTRLEAFLEDNLSGAGREVRIVGFRGALSSQATVDSLTIADAEGVWLTLDGVTLDWTRSALLSGALEVNALTATRVTVVRLPEGQASALPVPEAAGFALPELPVSMRIGRIAAPEIVLGEAVLGTPVTGSLEASGALSGGEGRGSLTILRTDDGPEGRIALTASFANSSRQLLFDLDAEEGADGIAATLLGLPGRPAVGLRIAGNGPLSDFSADVTLASDGVERLAGTLVLQALRDGGTGFTADIGGDLAPLFLPEYATFFGDALRLQTAGMRGPDGRFDLSAFDLQARTFAVSGQLALAADGLPERVALALDLADPTGAPVLLPAYGRPTRVDSAALTISYDRPAGEAWTLRGTLRGLDRPDLRLASVTLDGSGRIGRRQGGRAAVGGTLKVEASGLSPRDAALAEAVGPAIAARAVFSWLEGSDGFRLGRGEVAGADYGATFAGTVQGLSDGFRLDGRGEVRAEDLSRFAAVAGRPLAGRLSARVVGTGSPLGGDFDIEAALDGQDVAVGQSEADGLLRNASRVRLSVVRDTAGTALRDLAIEAGGGTVAARGRIATAGSDIEATFDLPDLAVLGVDYGGGIRASATFRGTAEAGSITLDGTLQDLTAGIPALGGLLRGATRLSLAADLSGGAVTLLRAEAANPQATLSATGRLDPAGNDLKVTAALADLEALGTGWRGALSAEAALTGAAGAERVVVAGTGRSLRLGNPELDRLLAGDTTLSADLTRAEERLIITAARLANPQVTLTASGTADGTASEITVDGRLANLALLVPEFPGVLSLTGTVAQGGSGYGLDLRLQGPGRIAATVAGQVAPGLGRADLRLSGTALAALANPFLGQRSLSGEAAFDLRLNGPLALASLSGPVRLSGGRLSDPDVPFSLTGITATANLAGGAAQVTAAAQSTSGGSVAAEGRIGLQPPLEANLGVTLQGLRLRDPRLYDTRADGRVRLTGAMAGGGQIAGEIALSATELRIPEASLAGSGPLPDLRHRREPGAVRDTRRKAGLLEGDGGAGLGGGADGPVFGLDIVVSAPSRIFLRGRGLDLEMGGALRLGGTTAAVVASGAFELIRGRLDILGKRLEITEARLDLQGDLVPTIRAAATTQSDGDQVGVEIEGPATAPTVRFTSAAGLPEEEVLARLLFGQGLDNISALQAAQLAGAIATLAGRGGDGIVGRLRKGFGLDDLDIQTDGEGGATLRAGRYLSDNIYSGIELAPGGKSRVNLNLDLRDGVTVKGSVDSDGQTGIGIYLENDY
jgi:translocation and assembly module TamB